jgi:hypothetical protein
MPRENCRIAISGNINRDLPMAAGRRGEWTGARAAR